MNPLGFLRITAASSPTTVADPRANRQAIEVMLDQHRDSDIVLFQELSLSGYSCGELFTQQVLLDACLMELRGLVASTAGQKQLVVVGLPLRIDSRLYNVAAAIANGTLLGLVPKQYLPTYQEFYEGRWFHAGRWYRNGTKQTLTGTDDLVKGRCLELVGLGSIPFGVDLLFESGEAVVGIEICEDLWMPIPPSSMHSIAGANVLLNLSASNETVGKSVYRRQLVASQSGRCVAAYAYSSAGPGESTTDLVFGGHCLIAENGAILEESKRVGSGLISSSVGTSASTDVDLGRLTHDRQVFATMHQVSIPFDLPAYRQIRFELEQKPSVLIRTITGHPFVPSDSHELGDRCREIFDIQCAALAKRVLTLPSDTRLTIGISGGLDSTLALLVAVRMCRELGWKPTRIDGLTMPGFGTSSETLVNANRLMQLLGITAEQIDIRLACIQAFKDLNHTPLGIPIDAKNPDELKIALQEVPHEQQNDLVFENVQARIRTLLLMSRGFVLGTGDLSESALGWSTYNADHMSMYNVNTSVPKTLVRFLVRYVAENEFDGDIRTILLAIVNTPISPELLPLTNTGQVRQSTESSIGPYELHDFFMYHLIRTGASPQKILFLARQAKFENSYSEQQLRDTLRTFLLRFFRNQFKRSCVPDGPKVGTVSLSPRSDWRMPSDASVQAWLDSLDAETPFDSQTQ